MNNDANARPVALITGASHGIGLAVARQLAERGMQVVLTARDEGKANAAAESLRGEGFTATAATLDVADDQSVRECAAFVQRSLGRLDVLVNNAAGSFDYEERALTADLANVRTTLETSLFGAWRMIQAFLPLLRLSERARIVNVSSGAGSFGDTQFGLQSNPASLPSYSVSKTALNAATVILAKELRGTGILLNAVCPGLTASHPGMEAMPGARPVDEGAAGIVWAATLPDDGPSGGLFRDTKPLPW